MPVSRPTSVASHHQDGVTLPMSPSSAISRPLHNESSRPTSRASSHRSSSRATSRPLSSASIRPKSRTGHGAPSKFSQRLPSRQISRIIPLCHALVSQVTGLQPQDEEGDFRALVDVVIRSLDYHAKAAPSSSMNDIVKQLHGSVSTYSLPVVAEPDLVVLKEHG
jgi:gamma-tubulin complex component 5